VTHAKANTVIAVDKRKSHAAILHHHPLSIKFRPFIYSYPLLQYYQALPVCQLFIPLPLWQRGSLRGHRSDTLN